MSGTTTQSIYAVCKIKSFQIQIIGEKKEEKQNQKRMTQQLAAQVFFSDLSHGSDIIQVL